MSVNHAMRGWRSLALSAALLLPVAPAWGTDGQDGAPDQLGDAPDQGASPDQERGQQDAPGQREQQAPQGQQDQQAPRGQQAQQVQEDVQEISGDIDVKLASPRSAEQKRALSASAALLLTHVDAARKAVGKEDRKAALTQIDKALKLSRIIAQSAPRYVVTTTIRSGDLKYQDREQVRGTLVPIYDELRQVSVLGPVEAAKRQSARVAQPGTAITDIDLQRTRVLLSTEAAQAHLGAARAALAGKGEAKGEARWEDADAALSAVQSGVIFEFVETSLPLLKASQNLALARARLSGKGADLADARAALIEAADALDSFAETATGTTAEEAGQMVIAIRALADDLESNAVQGKGKRRGQGQAMIARTGQQTGQIDRWWNKVSDWRASAS